MKIRNNDKRDKYLDLARELRKIWKMRMIVILIVRGQYGMFPDRLEQSAPSEHSTLLKLEHKNLFVQKEKNSTIQPTNGKDSEAQMHININIFDIFTCNFSLFY